MEEATCRRGESDMVCDGKLVEEMKSLKIEKGIVPRHAETYRCMQRRQSSRQDEEREA